MKYIKAFIVLIILVFGFLALINTSPRYQLNKINEQLNDIGEKLDEKEKQYDRN